MSLRLGSCARVAGRAARNVLLSRSLARRVAAVRDARFAAVTEQDRAFFRSLLGPSGVVEDATALSAMNRDWMGSWTGNSTLALRPASTHEVANVLKYCNERRIAVVPQGGNTGLVGGSVPLFDEVILSLARLSKVLHFDEHSGVVTAEAGVILEALNAYLLERGFIMPLDLGAKGSCQIGGNAATNAGGIRYLRYGSLHGSILGLEAVLADGRVVDCLSTLRKDNTGYDVKQLFIGSEGTLGVITKLAIAAAPAPRSTQVALVAADTFESVLRVLRRARSEVGEVLSAFEFSDRPALDNVFAQLPGVRDPFETKHRFYALVETQGSNREHDSEKLNVFLQNCFADGMINDGVVAQDDTQAKALWRLREGIPEATAKRGPQYKYDLSIPTAVMYKLVEDVRARVGDRALVVGYGHVGDGNVHINVMVQRHTDEMADLLEPFVFERVAAYKGSVSAEHGIGQCKVPYLSFSKSEASISLMRSLKDVMDPRGILNPYKVLPSAP